VKVKAERIYVLTSLHDHKFFGKNEIEWKSINSGSSAPSRAKEKEIFPSFPSHVSLSPPQCVATIVHTV
jgi:hypothetical protein